MRKGERMTEKKTRRPTAHREATETVRTRQTGVVNVPIIGAVAIPRPEQWAYYGGLAVLTALELIEWPVALIIATGHLLANNHHNQVLEELGAALEEV